jgi:hypothetical protein
MHAWQGVTPSDHVDLRKALLLDANIMKNSHLTLQPDA